MATNIIRNVLYSDFEHSIKVQTKLDFSSVIYKNVYLWFKDHPDQTVISKISGYPGSLTKLEKDEYKRFGLYINDTSVGATNIEREHIIILTLDAFDSRDVLQSEIDKYIFSYLPEEKYPTYYIVEKDFNNYDDIIFYENKIKEILPYCNMLYSYGRLKTTEFTKNYIAKQLESLSDYKLIYTTDDIEKIAVEFDHFNEKSIDLFLDLEKKVLEQYDDKGIIVYTGIDQNNLYCKFAAYMKYFHAINCNMDKSSVSMYLNYYSSMLFNRKRMLVEDQFKYLQMFPDITVKLSDFGAFLVLKKSMTVRASISYFSVEDIETSNVSNATLDISALDIVSIKDLYNFSTSDRDIITQEHTKLLNLIKQFESKVAPEAEIFDMTNIFFFEDKGDLYIAHIDYIDVDLDASILPVAEKRSQVAIHYGIDEISSLYPVEVFDDYEPYITKVSAMIRRSNPGYEPNLDVYKCTPKLGILLSFFHTNGKRVIKIPESIDFITLGLWWEETYVIRNGLYRVLLEHIPLRNLRILSEYLSIFGGMHPWVSQQLILTEKFLGEVKTHV